MAVLAACGQSPRRRTANAVPAGLGNCRFGKLFFSLLAVTAPLKAQRKGTRQRRVPGQARMADINLSSGRGWQAYPTRFRARAPSLTAYQPQLAAALLFSSVPRSAHRPPPTILRTTLRKMSATNSGPRVAIIGGGIQGAASAYYLTDRGAQVTLIEGSTIAAGASGKAGGLLALDWHGKVMQSPAKARGCC